MSENADHKPLPPLPVRRVGDPRPLPSPVPAPPVKAARGLSGSRAVATGIAAALLLGALAVAALLIFNPFNQCSACGQVLAYTDQGHTHIGVATPHPTYNSDPPTSGWHREEFPQNSGAVDLEKPLDDEVSVHLMEHGNIIMWYNCPPGPDCTAIHDGLVGVGTSLPAGAFYHVYVMPRASLPNHAVIALGAWQHLEYLAGFDKNSVTDFVQHFGGGIQQNTPTPTTGR
ncbi:MAG: DUF3105 domain-containing protein [Chloroflexia bacterium]